MRCGCRFCGTYMIQRDKGLDSGCVCPDCGSFCSACMGTSEDPKTPSQLSELFEDLVVSSEDKTLPLEDKH